MGLLENHRVPLITSLWMIGLPLAFAFVASAGAGTALAGLASFAGTVWSIFGGASLMMGTAVLLWVLWRAWRAGDLSASSKELNG